MERSYVRMIERECPICLIEYGDDATILKCGHAYCFACICDWCCRKRSACPICEDSICDLTVCLMPNAHRVYVHPHADHDGLILAHDGDDIFVQACRDESPASIAGMLPGDRIVCVDDRAATSPRAVHACFASARASGRMSVVERLVARSMCTVLTGTVLRMRAHALTVHQTSNPEMRVGDRIVWYGDGCHVRANVRRDAWIVLHWAFVTRKSPVHIRVIRDA